VNNLELAIENALAAFPFDQAAMVYNVMGWVWHDTKPRTPTAEEITAAARDLLNLLRDPGVERASSGGLEASLKDGVVTIMFTGLSGSSDEV